MSKNLLEPILERGVRHIAYFNGRLMTAEDLRVEQASSHWHDEQLGQAIGEGVVRGLQVRALSPLSSPPSSPPTSSPPGGTVQRVSVSAGLAFNRKGQALFLPTDVDVTLITGIEPPARGTGLFGVCEPPQSTALLAGIGAYLLALAPASGFQDRALLSGLSDHLRVGTACGSRYAVEGVQFRLARLDVDDLPNISTSTRDEINHLMLQSDAASRSRLRNLLAHLCFGTEALTRFPRDPFRREPGSTDPLTPGATDELRKKERLTACDVPLALFLVTPGGIQFVDMGSVRRRPTPMAPTPDWLLAPTGGYPSRGEAVSIQFQEHLAQLMGPAPSPSQLDAIEAVRYFRYLPAVGILPVGGTTAAPGFDYRRFFNTLPYRNPVFLEGATFEPLVRGALPYAPIDLRAGELIWLYLIRENMQAIDLGPPSPPGPYLIFTSGHVPYQANARFNLAWWNYSNYL